MNMKNKRTRMTQDELKKLVRYCPQTGEFTSCKTGKFVGSVVKSRSKKYYQMRLLGKAYMAHRVVWLYVYGHWPKQCIDHKDRNGLNNKLENLRDVSLSLNQRNRNLSKNNTSGISGVTYSDKRKAWTASITLHSKTLCLGQRKSLFEACCLRKSAENKNSFYN